MSHLDRYTPGAESKIPTQKGSVLETDEQAYYQVEVWDLRDTLAVLWRHRLLIFLVFTACVASSAFLTTSQTPIYRATAEVLVEGERYGPYYNGHGYSAVSEMLGIGRHRSVETQVQILQRTPVVTAALKSLHQPVDREHRPVVKAQATKDTDIIRVIVEDPDNRFACEMANAVVNAYVAHSQASNRASASSTKDLLEKQLKTKKRELEESEGRLKEYKERCGIVSITEAITNRTKRLAEAESQLATSEAHVKYLQAQLKSVEAFLSKAEETYLASSTSIVNPLVGSMEAQIASLEIQRAGLLKEYQPHAPEVLTLDEQIKKARANLQAALQQKMIASGQTVAASPIQMALLQQAGSLSAETIAHAARVEALRHSVAAERKMVEDLPGRERRMVAMLRDLSNLERDYAELSSRYQEVSVAEQARLPSACMLEPAELPLVPVKPRPLLNLALAAVVGLMLGVMLAFLLDHLDDTIKSTEDVDRFVGLPTLGAIPAMRKPTGPILVGAEDNSMLAESFRLLRSNIRFASPDKPLRSVMVTSSGAGEGKTTTAANLAYALANNGLRVILVDTDLRRPAVGKMFGISNGKGLCNVVLGDMVIEDVLQQTKVENLRVLLPGPLPPNPVEFLDSARCRAVLQQLGHMADFVVFDTPPASFLTDGMVLCTQADGVLVVANPGKTTHHALRRVVEQLLMAKGNLLGVCLNRMEAGSHGYGYYYYSYYHYYSRNGDGNNNGNGMQKDAKMLQETTGKAEPVLPEAQQKGEDS
jgi:capsular exopolysaccharide synthesis family protein